MKRGLIILLAVTVAHGGELADYPTALDVKINATFNREPSKRDLAWVTPETRPQIEARFKEALKDDKMREWGLAGLLMLEDRVTISGLIEQYHSLIGPGWRQGAVIDLFDRYASPAILPFLAGDLDDSRVFFKGGGDTPGDIEWREKSATIMNDLIMRWPGFAPETKAWAKSIARYGDKFTQMKPWWEHNKDAVLAHQYERATWLPATAAENEARGLEEQRKVLASITYAEVTTTRPDGTATKEVSGKRPSHRAGWFNIWALSACGVLSVAALYVFCRRRFRLM